MCVGFVLFYFVNVLGDLLVVLLYGIDLCFGMNLFCVVYLWVGKLLLLFDFVMSVIVYGKMCVVYN